jgi:hypothetical protein
MFARFAFKHFHLSGQVPPSTRKVQVQALIRWVHQFFRRLLALDGPSPITLGAQAHA